MKIPEDIVGTGKAWRKVRALGLTDHVKHALSGLPRKVADMVVQARFGVVQTLLTRGRK